MTVQEELEAIRKRLNREGEESWEWVAEYLGYTTGAIKSTALDRTLPGQQLRQCIATGYIAAVAGKIPDKWRQPDK